MIEVTNLTRYYGDFAALADVSFTAKEGQIVGLLGRNGAGKSTTLKILAGLLPPSEGNVIVDGIDMVTEPHKMRARIGYLPEDPPLYVDMTVEGFIGYIGRLNGMSATQVAERMDSVLESTQLIDRRDQVIDTLSHGYRKRVGIAQAIIHNPRLVILDEPISGLDPEQIVAMRTVIRRLAEGRVVMVSSHILSEVQHTCDHLLVIEDGRLVRSGTIDELSRPVLRLIVRGSPARFFPWLEARPEIETMTPLNTDRDTDGLAMADVTLNSEAREKLAADLISAGFGLRSMSDEGSLERAFLGMAQPRGEA